MYNCDCQLSILVPWQKVSHQTDATHTPLKPQFKRCYLVSFKECFFVSFSSWDCCGSDSWIDCDLCSHCHLCCHLLLQSTSFIQPPMHNCCNFHTISCFHCHCCHDKFSGTWFPGVPSCWDRSSCIWDVYLLSSTQHLSTSRGRPSSTIPLPSLGTA